MNPDQTARAVWSGLILFIVELVRVWLWNHESYIRETSHINWDSFRLSLVIAIEFMSHIRHCVVTSQRLFTVLGLNLWKLKWSGFNWIEFCYLKFIGRLSNECLSFKISCVYPVKD